MNRTTTENAILIVALLGVMVAGLAQGATLRYRGCGDYTNVFSLTGTIGWYDSSVPGRTSLPGPVDLIRVNGGCTVTVTTVEIVGEFQVGVDESGHLVVESGGKLSAIGSFGNAVGYNGYAYNVYGRMTVNTNGEVNCSYYLLVGYMGFGVVTLDGGTLNLSHHLWVGASANGNGTIILTNGGTLNMTGANNNNGMIGLGTINAASPSGGIGTIKVSNGGVLNLFTIDPNGGSIQPGSVLDISGSGVVTIPNDRVTTMSNYVAAGKITAYGGTGMVAIDYDTSNPGKTTLKALGGYVPPTDCAWIATNGLGSWCDPANWPCGLHPVGVTAAIFNVPGAIPCTVNCSAMASYVVMGTNGPGGTLIVTNGGTLTCTSSVNANVIGWNSNALMVVETGGVVTFGDGLSIGLYSGADGTLLMNGGTVSVAGMFDLGYQGGKGTAQIKGGILELSQWDDYASIMGQGALDVTGTGKVVINGDHQYSATLYISTGQITNSSGAGLLVDYNIINLGKTTVSPADLYLPPAQVVWNPAANPSSTGLWDECANWNVGMCPGDVTVVTFNVAGAIPCLVTSAATAGYISMGNSAGPGGTLILTNGGNLTTLVDNWSGVGYSSTALMIVENGSSASFRSHLWVGFASGADGTLLVNGGTVWVGGMFGLGSGGGIGFVQVNGGTLNCAQWHDYLTIGDGSVLDIAGTGTVLITGNHVNSVSNYIREGKITANGGAGTVAYGYDPEANKTTLQVAPPRQSVTSATVSGGNTTITYQTTAGHIYHIESTPSLSPASWTRLTGSTTNATGASVTFTFPTSGDQRFYRTVSP